MGPRQTHPRSTQVSVVVFPDRSITVTIASGSAPNLKGPSKNAIVARRARRVVTTRRRSWTFVPAGNSTVLRHRLWECGRRPARRCWGSNLLPSRPREGRGACHPPGECERASTGPEGADVLQAEWTARSRPVRSTVLSANEPQRTCIRAALPPQEHLVWVSLPARAVDEILAVRCKPCCRNRTATKGDWCIGCDRAWRGPQVSGQADRSSSREQSDKRSDPDKTSAS